MVGFIASFFIQLAVGLVLMVIAYALAPKPKRDQPDATRDLDNPTAETGRPVPVVFGTITVKSANVLWYGDKRKRERMVKA